MLNDEVGPRTVVFTRRSRAARHRDKLGRDGADADSRLVDDLDQFGERLLRGATPEPDQHSDREIDHFARRAL